MNLKHTIVTLATILSCSTTYAKRDYDQYPEYKEEIALYNLNEIAKDRCTPESSFIKTIPRCVSMNFKEDEFEYNYKGCHFWVDRPIATASGGQTSKECTDKFSKTYTFRWEDITRIIPSSYTVKVCTKDQEDCTNIDIFNNEQQAYDFAEALNIYRKSKK